MMNQHLKICDTVFRPALNPACSSAGSSLAVFQSVEDAAYYDFAGMAYEAQDAVILVHLPFRGRVITFYPPRTSDLVPSLLQSFPLLRA